jgi:hypothetical protein
VDFLFEYLNGLVVDESQHLAAGPIELSVEIPG